MTQEAVAQVDGQGDLPVGEAEALMIPLERGELRRSKAIRFSDAELERLEKFQEWLSVTIDPKTGQPFIPRNQFGDLIQFSLNVAYYTMGKVVEQMVQAEEAV